MISSRIIIFNPLMYLCLMKREVIETEDGSKTIYLPDWNENYHSVHGALQEANHVFLKHGLQLFVSHSKLQIFEMGYGTGLNAFLTAIKAKELKIQIEYHAIEAYPVSSEELILLEYDQLQGEANSLLFNQLQAAPWGQLIEVSPYFSIHKVHSKLEEFNFDALYFDLIYYDAFGPKVQDELWSIECFEKMYNTLKENGVLVTYCAQGQVKRNLKSVGFEIEALPGPPGKREMTRALKR